MQRMYTHANRAAAAAAAGRGRNGQADAIMQATAWPDRQTRRAEARVQHHASGMPQHMQGSMMDGVTSKQRIHTLLYSINKMKN